MAEYASWEAERREMKIVGGMIALFVGSLGVGLLPATTLHARVVEAPAKELRTHPGGHATTYNWSGTYAEGSADEWFEADGSWTIPVITCGTGATTDASAWVGIGNGSADTLLQDGVAMSCSDGTPNYAVWWEAYPLNAEQDIGPQSYPVFAGDHVIAGLAAIGSQVTFYWTDKAASGALRWQTSFAPSLTVADAFSSAECIVERTSNGNSFNVLTKFKPLIFSSCNAAGETFGPGPLTPSTKIPGQTVESLKAINASGKILIDVGDFKDSGGFKATWKRAT